MKYKTFYKSKAEPERNFEIVYCVCEDEDSFYIESYIEGGAFFQKIYIGTCCEKTAEDFARFLAEKSVHPLHIEDIISDLLF